MNATMCSRCQILRSGSRHRTRPGKEAMANAQVVVQGRAVAKTRRRRQTMRIPVRQLAQDKVPLRRDRVPVLQDKMMVSREAQEDAILLRRAHPCWKARRVWFGFWARTASRR